MEYLGNRYLVKMRGGRTRPEQQLKRTITFDPIVGSRLNFYRSF
jgi:hypothetical protein